MEIVNHKEARTGDAILWPKKGQVANTLSLILGWYDPKTWKPRKWKPWHVGFIVKILPEGEVVTSQAVGNGVHSLVYDSIDDLAECKIYRWLKDPDQEKTDKYAEDHEGDPYDKLDYIWVLLGALSEKFLHWPFRIVNKAQMCWENLSHYARDMGDELQPEEEPCLINKIILKLESKEIRA